MKKMLFLILAAATLAACSTVCKIPGVSSLPGCPTPAPTAAAE